MSKHAKTVRYAEVDRETEQSTVSVSVDLDGGTKVDVNTGILFLDHMLEVMGESALIDLGLSAHGDIEIDDHHTVEDIGIALGVALKRALIDSGTIARYGTAHVPMDDALVLVALDFCGRGYLAYDVEFKRDAIGGLSMESVREFFMALALNAGITIHIKKIAGVNDHHLCEAVFKAFGHALGQSVVRSQRETGQVRTTTRPQA